MKKIILYGNGEFSKLLKYYIENDSNREVVAVTVDRKYISSNTFEGLPLVAFEECETYYSPEKYEILICVGYSKMNTIRQEIFRKCKDKGYKIASYIHNSAIIADNVELGEGNIILENTLIQPFCKIGDGNLIWYKVSIAHECNIGNFNTIAGMCSISGIVKIKNNCFLGNNSTIRDKINLANYTLVGAGTYINNDTEEYGVYIPERSIKINKNSLDIVI